ncbi:hypothetical protein QQ045_004282 [Rhodiola kirilowii]
MGKLCLVRLLNLVKVAEPCIGVEKSAVVSGSLVHRKALSSEAAKPCIGVEKSNEASLCNLERFIKAVTPLVPARCFPELMSTDLIWLRSEYSAALLSWNDIVAAIL